MPPATPKNTIVLPGHPLGPASKFSPGPGTHIQADHIYASILGRLTTTTTTTSKPPPASKDKSSPISLPTLSVARPSPPNVRTTPLLPAVGALVYARISRVQRLQALCEIVVLSDGPSARSNSNSSAPSPPAAQSSPAPQAFRGIIRAQDVRATEKDKVVMGASFRVGDIVRAVVISLGDQGGYFLSTAGNELGVVMAWGSGEGELFGRGNACVPVSWCEVVDVVSGVREGRKVAKPI